MEAKLAFLYKHLDVTFVEDTLLEDDPKVIAALKANNMVEAIKLFRAATNANTEAAKAAVEEMRIRLGLRNSIMIEFHRGINKLQDLRGLSSNKIIGKVNQHRPGRSAWAIEIMNVVKSEKINIQIMSEL